MDKKWIFFVLLLGAGITALVLSQPEKQNLSYDFSQIDKDAIVVSSEASPIGDHTVGTASDAKVVIVEYGDFQCPACANYDKRIKSVISKFETGVVLTFRHFPLPGHTSAKAAAGVAEAAGLQGKYWEMHEILFANYLNWSADVNRRDATLLGYAEQLGLDLEKFKSDLNSEAIKQKIARDTALGQEHNLRETPTIILNGEKVDSEIWSDEEKFEAFIKEKLAE